VLIPDFRGDWNALDVVLAVRPDILNHNTETVPRLYRQVRKGAVYERSLELLRRSKEAHPEVPTKTGLMLGLEKKRTKSSLPAGSLRAGYEHSHARTVSAAHSRSSAHRSLRSSRRVAEYKILGEAMGFKHVEAGPLVRSSYHAFDQAESAIK